MIQSHEIKVGNRFIRELHNSHGLEYDHDFVLTEEWMGKLFGDNTSIALQDLNPMPLSPEILERCGFKKGKYGEQEQWLSPEIERHNPYSKFQIGIINNPIYGFTFNLEITIVSIRSLHELQNLYYALTKTELNYQP